MGKVLFVCFPAPLTVCYFWLPVFVCVCVSLPVPERRNEVEAAVDSVVLDVLSVQPALIPEVLLKLLIYVVCDRLPAGTHIHTHTHTHFSSSSRLNMAHVSVQQVFQLTTRCCWRRLRTPACRRWSAWAWPLSPRCRQCVWWSPQFGWFALQSIDAQTGRGWWGENKVKLLEQQVRDSVEQARMWMVQNALPVGIIQVSDCFSTPYMINKWFMTVLIL